MCTVFHNQMNGIRQYFVIYLFTLSIIYYINNNKGKSFIDFIIGIGIHKSIVILFPFYFLINRIKKITKIEGYVLLISSIIILIFFPVMEFVKLILVHIPYYDYYYLIYLKENNNTKRYLYITFVLVVYIYKIITFYKYKSFFNI